MTDPNDILFGSSVPAAKFAQIGDRVSGQIVSLGSSQQSEYRKPGSTAPAKMLTWPDGSPMMQVIVTLQTNQRDPSVADDDGQRRIFVKGKRLTNAVRDAVRGSGARKLELGGTLTVKWVGEEDTGAGSPAKVYEVSYQRPQPGVQAANQALGFGAQDPSNPRGVAPQHAEPYHLAPSTPAPQPYDGARLAQAFDPAAALAPLPGQPLPPVHQPAQQPVDVSNLTPEAQEIVKQMLERQAATAAQSGGTA